MVKDKYIYLTLDLEPDHAGYAPESYEAWQVQKVRNLLTILKKHSVPLSVFVVANSINKNKPTIKLFEKYGCEFYLHSYSHKINEADSQNEITKGIKTFKEYFGRKPLGYRAPGGLITEKGLERIAASGFTFDSSIIPSFWPILSYFGKYDMPYFTKSGLLEIPFSVISPFKLVLGLSWIRLFGWNTYSFLLRNRKLPKNLFVHFHLHDLWRVKAFDRLSIDWKLKYIRNKRDGLDTLEKLIVLMVKLGYKFRILGDYVKSRTK